MTNIKYNSIALLLKSQITVFSNRDLALLWQIDNRDYLKAKIYRLIKSGQLIRLQGGLYALDNIYDQIELANKLVVPSYVSTETILSQEGVIFQNDSRIYSISRQNRSITIKNQEYIYRKIKDSALQNNRGIVGNGFSSKASKERALVDLLYLVPDFYFDNLSNIDWEACLYIAQIFQNKSLVKRIIKLKEENA